MNDIGMSPLLVYFFVFVLATFTGRELISKVPQTLHTPLMSGSNAIWGITIVGALLFSYTDGLKALTPILGFAALVLATVNVVGGFLAVEVKRNAGKPVAIFRHHGVVTHAGWQAGHVRDHVARVVATPLGPVSGRSGAHDALPQWIRNTTRASLFASTGSRLRTMSARPIFRPPAANRALR